MSIDTTALWDHSISELKSLVEALSDPSSEEVSALSRFSSEKEISDFRLQARLVLKKKQGKFGGLF